jgi:type I restriction enzyme S subunit
MTARHVALGDVAEFIRGITFKPDDVEPIGTPGVVACMRTSNVQAELAVSDVWGVSPSLVKRADQFLRRGDVLVSTANSWNLVGKCCWVGELPWRATFGGFVSVLRANRNELDPRFLYRWFASPRIQTTLRSFGQRTTSISNLNIHRCLALRVPLPPLPEQRRIAEVLDRADGLRAKRRAAIAQLDTLAQSIFLDMFGDPSSEPETGVALGDAVEMVTVGHVGPTSDFFCEDGVPFLRTGNVGALEILTADLKRITPEFHRRLRKSTLKTGDVLVSRVISDEVRCAVVPPELDGANCANVIVIRPGQRMDSDYLTYLINSPRSQSGFLQHQVGSAQSVVNTRVLQNWRVDVPAIERQKAFSTRVQALRRVRGCQTLSLAALDALFTSLQHRAFSGRL